MSRIPIRYRAIPGVFALVTIPGVPALAEIPVTASRSLTVQPAGPRQGEVGSRYFNVEGPKNDRYASFGVLAFELPRDGGQGGDVKTMSLRLVQSIARFAKDGKVRFYLAEPQDRGADLLPGLKFDAKSPHGVGKDVFKALHPRGSGAFRKVETGHADTFELRPDQAGQRSLRDRMKAGGTILIVAVPDDDEVVATYFGAGPSRKGIGRGSELLSTLRSDSSPVLKRAGEEQTGRGHRGSRLVNSFATIWQHHWQHDVNAATIPRGQGNSVSALHTRN